MRFVRAFTGLIVFGLVASSVVAQEADRFLGTWQAKSKFDGMDQTMEVSRDGAELKLAVLYKKKDEIVGSAVGVDVRVEAGLLEFKLRYLTKPVQSWPDVSVPLKMRVAGGAADLLDGKTSGFIRGYVRIGAPSANPEPKAFKIVPDPDFDNKKPPKKDAPPPK